MSPLFSDGRHLFVKFVVNVMYAETAEFIGNKHVSTSGQKGITLHFLKRILSATTTGIIAHRLQFNDPWLC